MSFLPEPTVEIWGGMECTINRVRNHYFDQLDYAGHRERKNDIPLFASLGLKKFRYPILWERHQPQANKAINWDATDQKLADLCANGIQVIAGLVHHGSGPAFVNMLEDSFAAGLAEYAGQVATRYPWIDYYTPVNEPLTTARFCGLYGIWYPHEQQDSSFCRLLVNECRATVLAMAAIRVINPGARLVQTDDLAKIHSTAGLQYQADFENERRWLSYDLLCGKVNANHSLWDYMRQNGISAEELNDFEAHPCPPDILGVNYYLTSERYLDEATENYPLHTHGGNGQHTYADVEAVRVGQICPDGIEVLLKAAWDRYQIPIALTEIHLHCTREEQMRWLNDAWFAANHLSREGIPVIAVTPWALLGSFGWDQLLTRPSGHYEAGVFDVSGGQPRLTALGNLINSMANNQPVTHPVLQTPGWWKRSCRAVYGSDKIYLPVVPSGKALAVSGRHAAELIRVCRERGLRVTSNQPAPKTWATIRINEYLEVDIENQAGLVVWLDRNNLAGSIHKALDLLLDNESGYWGFKDKLLPEQQHEMAV